MKLRVSPHEVNEAVAHAVYMAIWETTTRCCTDTERAKVSLCLEHPSESTLDGLTEIHGDVFDCLVCGVTELLDNLLAVDTTCDR